ncbi:SRR1-like protein isoform X1 [Aricia agestis]|uniref:SRR1-like protein isoform X1 n=1 Tax=Aricia agestis TaxID=91739 RepID=UPI001C20342C|nr:SRR1-like protein isoform X1 [Aricia agestis]
MSKPAFDSDGFQIILRSKKGKAKKLPQKDITFVKENIEINIPKARRRILSCIEDLRNSTYSTDVNKSVSSILKHKEVVEIVCFGLGHVGECLISQYQLALLLCTKEALKLKKVSVHDPIFSTSECALLKSLDINVIEENNEGSYIISKEGVTIVYLPHCPKQLTNNFIWSNWGSNLQNCILICNSFTSLIENQPSRLIKDIVPYIYKISSYTTEINLENSFVHKDIFNDTSIHYFTKEKLDSVPSDFWVKQDKPTYENTEEFITSLMVEKLTI